MVSTYALQLKNRLGLDDSLDVVPVRGVAGLVGILLTGVLALIRQVLPLRVSPLSEQQGLDINAHGKEAYNSEFTG